jgi:hypothetical protein
MMIDDRMIENEEGNRRQQTSAERDGGRASIPLSLSV